MNHPGPQRRWSLQSDGFDAIRKDGLSPKPEFDLPPTQGCLVGGGDYAPHTNINAPCGRSSLQR
eukprot:16238127-Heterocapsa_arctica.AAC.1